jgi:hypothetical protein
MRYQQYYIKRTWVNFKRLPLAQDEHEVNGSGWKGIEFVKIQKSIMQLKEKKKKNVRGC